MIPHAPPRPVGPLMVPMIEGDLPDCADGAPWRPVPTVDVLQYDSGASSTHGRGHTPGRCQRGGGTGDRSSAEAVGPRCRSARGDLRLDGAPAPWHNRTDWLGLSELETVTRVRRSSPGPHPSRDSPYAIRTTGPRHRRAMDADALWKHRPLPQGTCKTAKSAVSHSAHSRHP